MTTRATLLGTTLGLLAQSRPAMRQHGTGTAEYERAAALLEDALVRTPREPALLPQLQAALGRLGQVPRREE